MLQEQNLSPRDYDRWDGHTGIRLIRPGNSVARRVFLIILDSFGIGEMPDADEYGDTTANTIKTISKSEFYNTPNLRKMGLYNIDEVDCLEGVDRPSATIARMAEKSKGKDTTTGHWELAGIETNNPFPTYPNGFPSEIIEEFSKETGRGVLCNRPYSGTQVIADYGEEHIKTGDLIVYTSADSVFQIAAHEDVVPIETLYEYCKIARKILQGKHGVGRVIARPFIGEVGGFTRTSNRHDFSLEPTGETMLDILSNNKFDVIGVGKIKDIFVGRGITEYVYTKSNDEGIERTIEYLKKDFEGLCFVNLVDCDMLYGHRRDIEGYAKAISYFDKKLDEIVPLLRDGDLLMISADHGCDPGYMLTTDHTREYVPFIMYGKNFKPINRGTRDTFADVAITILDYFDLESDIKGTSML